MPYKNPADRMKRYYQHKKQGICTCCWKNPVEPNRTRCSRCHQENLRNGQRRIAARRSRGICPKCGKQKIAPHHKWCLKCLARERKYHWAKRPKRLAHLRAYQQRLKLEALTHYSGGTPHCKCCGENDVALLTIDHIKNDGKKHRRQIRSNFIYSWLKQNEFPKGFAVLCFSCNIGRAQNKNGACPAHEAHAALKQLRTGISGQFYDLNLPKSGVKLIVGRGEPAKVQIAGKDTVEA